MFFIYLMARINTDTKGNVIDWHERRLISKMYVESFILKPDRVETRRVKNGKELDNDVVCRRFYSTCTANTLPRKLLKALKTTELEESNFCREIRR
jgi:hypothetical protein